MNIFVFIYKKNTFFLRMTFTQSSLQLSRIFVSVLHCHLLPLTKYWWDSNGNSLGNVCYKKTIRKYQKPKCANEIDEQIKKDIFLVLYNTAY